MKYNKKIVLTLAIASAGLLTHNLGYANTAPDSGDLSKDFETLPTQQQEPAADIDFEAPEPVFAQEDENAIKVMINDIQFVGNTVLSSEFLSAAIEDDIGVEHSFISLENLARSITREYQAEGYIMAQAYLPEQSLKDGLLLITINEGYLDQITIDQQGRLKTEVSQRYLAPLKGPVLNSEPLERQIRIMSDLAGSDLEVVFSPSELEGKTNLRLRSYDTGLINGYVALDNQGNRFTTAERISGQLSFNNALGYGESLGINLASSGKGYNYMALDGALPVGANGLTLTSQLSAMHYKLLENFEVLDSHGYNREVSLGAKYPFVRTLDDNIYGAINFTHQESKDKVDTVNSVKDKTINSAALSAYGDHTSFFGDKTDWQATLTAGSVELDSATKASDTHGVDGSFSKLNFGVDYNRAFNDKWGLKVSANAQVAQNNLDSAMKMSLGGASAVRAYPQGEVSVDNGVLTTLEARYLYSDSWQFSGFIDAADGQQFKNKTAADTDNNKTLSGVGLSANWNADDWYLNATLAWRTDSAPESDSRDLKPRYWLQLVKAF